MATDIQEGSKGNIARIKFTNNSVYTGTNTPAPYTFKLHVSVWSGGTIFKQAAQDLAMAPGETQTLDFPFDVPPGASGLYQATAFLNDSADISPASQQASVSGNITPAPDYIPTPPPVYVDLQNVPTLQALVPIAGITVLSGPLAGSRITRAGAAGLSIGGVVYGWVTWADYLTIVAVVPGATPGPPY